MIDMVDLNFGSMLSDPIQWINSSVEKKNTERENNKHHIFYISHIMWNVNKTECVNMLIIFDIIENST